jgi:hypothetical protein
MARRILKLRSNPDLPIASQRMHELSFFRKKNNPFAFAVTPDKTGLVLPSAEQWRYWFSQPVYPERGEGDTLWKYRAGFEQRGYYILKD